MNTFLRSGVQLVPVAIAAACLSLPHVGYAHEGWLGADGYSGLGEQHVMIPGEDPAMLKLAGTVVALKERVTRTGNRMLWARISDTSGSCEVTVFSEVLARSRDLLSVGSNVLVTVDLVYQADTLRITAMDLPVPFAHELETAFRPSRDAVIQRITEWMS